MQSCLYKGTISHKRRGAASNAFAYSLFMVFLDLDELDSVFSKFWFWSTSRTAIARFRRSDHYGDQDISLAESIRQLVAQQTGKRPEGAIRLLTHLRYFGYCFNPISVYYCYDQKEQLQDVVLEVSNTPWGEQHCYVLGADDNLSSKFYRYQFNKEFHVSPFMPMDMSYSCRFTPPDDGLYLALDNHRDGKKVFGTHLALEQQPINHRTLAKALLTDPLMTLRVNTLIHWQALRLWLKRATYYPYAKKTPAEKSKQSSTEIAHHG